MAINAHLIYGKEFGIDVRREEFAALMALLGGRLLDDEQANLILMGDLNLDFDDEKADRKRIDDEIRRLDKELDREGAHINFPFLDPHEGCDGAFRTNARQKQTYDHIGFFAHNPRLPSHDKNRQMPLSEHGPDYGMFNFMELFSEAIYGTPFGDLDEIDKKALYGKMEHMVSDHLPIWVRLPLV